MTEPIRVVVADDHPLFREGVVAALQSVDDIVVVGQAADADGALRVVREELPDVVLLDVSRPGSGLQAAARIATACPATRRDSPGRTSGRGEARRSVPVGLPAGAAQPLTWRGGRGNRGKHPREIVPTWPPDGQRSRDGWLRTSHPSLLAPSPGPACDRASAS